jgi:hypothetical protein
MSVFLVLEIVDGNESNPGTWVFKSMASAKAKVEELIEENREQGHEMDDDGYSQYVTVIGPEALELAE